MKKILIKEYLVLQSFETTQYKYLLTFQPRRNTWLDIWFRPINDGKERGFPWVLFRWSNQQKIVTWPDIT